MNKIIITVMVIMSFWGLCSGELEITQSLKEEPMNLSLMRLTNADKIDLFHRLILVARPLESPWR